MMITSRKFAASIVGTGFALVAAAVLVAPFADAQAAGGQVSAQRFDSVFAALPLAVANPALAQAAAHAAKGNLKVNCAGATWPDIDGSCLTGADGSPAHHVRSVTIGYDAEPGVTVLVRMPSMEVASR